MRVVLRGSEALTLDNVVKDAHFLGFFSNNLGAFRIGGSALGAAHELERVAATPHVAGGLADTLDFAEHVVVQIAGDAAGLENQNGLRRNDVASFAADELADRNSRIALA